MRAEVVGKALVGDPITAGVGSSVGNLVRTDVGGDAVVGTSFVPAVGITVGTLVG